MISYGTDLTGLTPDRLGGFFLGWPSPPDPPSFLDILDGSSHVVLAHDGDRVVGFVNAVSDGGFSAYLPLLEVLPSHQGRGIGTELVRRMLEQLSDFYSIDTVCDPELRPFYERVGGTALTGIAWRNGH